MGRNHSETDIQRFDLMKLGVLLLLMALLVLTWLITRNSVPDRVAEGAPGSPTAEMDEAITAYPDAGETGAIASRPAPTLVAPAIDAPTGSLSSGNVPLSGAAGPGAQVIILVNGSQAGSAIAGVDGRWSATIDLPAGDYEVQAQVVDNVGSIVSQTDPLQLTVSDSNGETAALEFATPEVDPVTGDFAISGLANPGDNVIVTSNGVAVATATADEAGNWSILVPAAAGAGDVMIQTTDAAGNVTSESGPILLAPMPPTPGPMATEPLAAEATAPSTGDETIGSLLQGRPEFSTLWAFAQSSGLTDTLAGQGPFTVFAPTNEAFDRLPPRVIDGLNANPEILLQLLQYHIARGRYLATDLMVVQPATLNDRLLTIIPQSEGMWVNDAIVTSPDNIVENGVVHAIDRILVPPLATGVRPPIIDDSGVLTFVGSELTIVGTAEPNRTILVELNGEPFGEAATVGPDGTWLVPGTVTPNDYLIVAYMLGAADALEAISRPVTLQVR